MALANGVLVHGPTAWACAIRTPDGTLKVESAHKTFRAAEIEQPLLRGPARLAEVMLLLPQVRRALPEARLPFERPRVLATMLGGAVATRLVKTSRLRPLAQELLAGAFSLAPAALAVRGSDVAAYHGAEHISIGSYEHGETRAKEHERCGSHIVGPLLLSSAVGGALAARAPEHLRGPLARRLSSAPSASPPSSSAGWSATRTTASRARSPSRATSCSTGWRPRSRPPSSSRSPRPRSPPAWSWNMELRERSKKRLSPEVFELPVEKMREGYYTDAYFNHARATLLEDGRRPRVVMQVFQKRHAHLGGIDEAIAILKLCSADWDDLTVHALYDGDRVEPYESVLTIEGDYTSFAQLETLYLGVLARRTLITTNVVRVLEAANGKPIIFMPARHDHHRVQTGDGYAAYVAGQVVGAPIGVTSDAQASWWGGKGVGTVPHALISAYGGNTVLAATQFAEWSPEDLNVVVLVDFETDSVSTALEVARALGPRLWGVRLDTSESLVDRSLWGELGDFKPTGVNERLVLKVRDTLDRDGFERVKIVVSGGFTVEKIREFEERGVPVDSYGVGSSLIRGSNDFTADVVLTDGRPSAKAGRRFRPNRRLELVE